MARFTEQTILQFFQEMLIEMPFDQIKVSTLTRRCEISPNTFYYHYRDIHDLLDAWLRERVDQELDAIPKSFSWTERLRSILNICKANEKIIFHISDSNARSQLERYVYETSREHVLNAVDERLGDVHISNARRQEIGDSFQVVFLGFFIRFLWSRMEDDIDSSVDMSCGVEITYNEIYSTTPPQGVWSKGESI